MATSGAGLIQIDTAVMMGAARLRAETSLRTPDAIHVAAATVRNRLTPITNDLAFRSVRSPEVQMLRDIART